MCFLIHRISFIPSAEDFTFISLDILMLSLVDSRSHFAYLGSRLLGHPARLTRSIELRHSRGSGPRMGIALSSTLVIIVALYSPPIRPHAFASCTRNPCSPCCCDWQASEPEDLHTVSRSVLAISGHIWIVSTTSAAHPQQVIALTASKSIIPVNAGCGRSAHTGHFVDDVMGVEQCNMANFRHHFHR
jgi:hypothetical protein